MNKRDTPNSARPSFEVADAARGIVITFVVAVIGYYAWLPTLHPERNGPSMSRGGVYMLLLGIGLQVAILVGKPLIGKYEKKHGLDGQISPMVVHILQLLADGLTVLLFALAVFGSIAQFPNDI
jgi:hypothetical protein